MTQVYYTNKIEIEEPSLQTGPEADVASPPNILNKYTQNLNYFDPTYSGCYFFLT